MNLVPLEAHVWFDPSDAPPWQWSVQRGDQGIPRARGKARTRWGARRAARSALRTWRKYDDTDVEVIK